MLILIFRYRDALWLHHGHAQQRLGLVTKKAILMSSLAAAISDILLLIAIGNIYQDISPASTEFTLKPQEIAHHHGFDWRQRTNKHPYEWA